MWLAIFPLSTTNTLGNRSGGSITTLERQKHGSTSKKSNARTASIDKYVNLRHGVVRAEWDENQGAWRIRVRDLDAGMMKDDAAEILIIAGGVLNRWKWPDLQGHNDIEGRLVHSAASDESLDLTGKRVAVVGAGSSVVHIVAAVQNTRRSYTSGSEVLYGLQRVGCCSVISMNEGRGNT